MRDAANGSGMPRLKDRTKEQHFGFTTTWILPGSPASRSERQLRSSFQKGYGEQLVPGARAPAFVSTPGDAFASRPRHLTALFRRDPRHDSQRERIRYEGYQIFWPDGEPMEVGFERFCQQGCRLLGLGKRLGDRAEQLVRLCLHPISGLEAPLTRPGPGTRCRRFYVQRSRGRGRLYFFNGSPTDMVFDTQQDDPRVVEWIGLGDLAEGECLWFDLSAQSI